MWIGILAGLATGALWGVVFVVPRIVSGFSAVDLTAGRFLTFGALSVVLMLCMRTSRLPTLHQAVTALGMSVLGFTGYYLLLVYGIRDAGTEVPSLIIGTIPIWMMLLGKPTGLRWSGLIPGLLLTVLGLGLMMQSSHSTSATLLEGAHFWRGVALSVAAMVLWTAFGVLNAAWLKKHPEINATTWANWLGVATGCGALLMWLAAGSDIKVLMAQDGIGLAVVICVATGIGAAWVATMLWNIASQRLPASLCGQLIVSETIFALVYSFVWDGRGPNLLQTAACILFVCGILASIRAHR